METNYKIVKLSNGDNIICEAVEHINDSYIIKTPLKMEVVHDDDDNGHMESLHLSAWISPFTENKYFEIKENHVIVITEASIGLSAYYKNIIQKQNKFTEQILGDELELADEPTDEEMFDQEYEEVLNETTNNDKSKYH
tara:strand:- start:47 stop:463 length:417 start_codon:yes stop_codon:yes gene_type:complete